MSMTKAASTLTSISLGNNRLKDYFAVGLGALISADKSHIKVPNTSFIKGSLALDSAAKQDMPTDSRWDYAIDYNGEVFFIEIHPASTSEISTMIKKVDCLRQWLAAIGADLLSLPPVNRKFYWVSSGNTQLRITPNSCQAKRLAAKKILSVGHVWDYNKIKRL